MKKMLILGSSLLLCGALALAQDSTQSSGTADSSSATGNTVQGCLSGSGGNYMLTDATGASYQLQGDDSQLSGNVNKQVEVTGTMGSKATATASGSPDSGASGSASAGQASGNSTNGSSNMGNSTTGSASGSTASASVAKTLSVTSIRKVADTCSSNSNASGTPQQ
jgi:hypothetical protein